MSSDLAISVRNLSKSYDLGLSGRTTSLGTILRERVRHPLRGGERKRERFQALDDLSFDIAEGEVVGVVGKNGAGKSTLLKILSRITPPSSGHIDLAGSVGSLLEVGTGFHPELTGRENVFLNGTILGMTRRDIERRMDEIVDFAEVDRFLETPVKRYSSGMRVRLAFAVAAHLEPDVMIVDEVLSVGDYAFQAKCLEKMRSIAADQGRTVLYVSHNLVTVEHLCPRSLLLVNGRLGFDGPTSETLSQYLRMFPRGERGAEVGVFDLSANRTSGEAAAVFKRLEIRPSGGDPTDTVRMGERLQLEVLVVGLDEVTEPNVAVTVGTNNIDCLFRMTARMVPLESAEARQTDETIVIDIPAVPLTPGDYHIGLSLFSKGEPVDEVRRAAEFSVIGADLLGTGYQFTAKDGSIVVPWGWELRPGDVGAAAQAETHAS